MHTLSTRIPRTRRASVMLLGMTLLGVVPAAGQAGRDLFAAIPRCASADASAFTAFEKADASAKAANEQARAALLTELQKNPSAAMDKETIHLMSKWTEFMTQPGAPPEIHSQADLFQPDLDWLNDQRDKLNARKADCNLGSDPKSQACHAAAQKELDAAERQEKERLRNKWPEYLSRTQMNISWHTRPLPPGINPRNLFIRQQLLAREAQAISDAEVVYEEGRTICGDPRDAGIPGQGS